MAGPPLANVWGGEQLREAAREEFMETQELMEESILALRWWSPLECSKV